MDFQETPFTHRINRTKRLFRWSDKRNVDTSITETWNLPYWFSIFMKVLYYLFSIWVNFHLRPVNSKSRPIKYNSTQLFYMWFMNHNCLTVPKSHKRITWNNCFIAWSMTSEHMTETVGTLDQSTVEPFLENSKKYHIAFIQEGPGSLTCRKGQRSQWSNLQRTTNVVHPILEEDL